MTTPYERCKSFSEEKLQTLRESIDHLVPTNDIVITCGSYARREASTNSDIDFL